MRDVSEKPSQRLLTFKSGGWVLLLAGVLTLFAAGLVLYPVWASGGFHRQIGDGKNVDTYGFDLSNLTIPKSQLTASGHPKDYMRDIPENLVETITPDDVKLIAQNEHIRFLVPTDRVIGLTINGTSRAYPLRVLNLHEVVNDTLGGTPIAVTYSALTDSVVVFDRRVDRTDSNFADGSNEPAEFGNAGLLVNSNAVFFDRRANTAEESLWPQLALKAVSGKRAGREMVLIPYDLTTWLDWTSMHPDTRVLQGLRTLKTEYGSDPYNTYASNDQLRFPVNPLWTSPIPLKTQIVIDWDGTKGIAYRDGAAPILPAGTTRLHSYLFGWYAQHPSDTDYSAIK